MSEQTKSRGVSPISKWGRRVLLWALALGLLVWIFHRVPPNQMLTAAREVSPLPFTMVALSFSLLTLFLDSFTHYWAFRRFNGEVPFWPVLRSRGETYLLLAVGFLYGQGGMAWAASRRLGKPLAEVTSSVLFLMFNNLMAMMVFPTLALLFFIDQIAASGFGATPEGRIITRWLFISWPVCLAGLIFFARDWDNPLRRRLKGGLSLAFDQARPRDYATAMGLRGLQVVLWCSFSWLGLRACQVKISFSDLFLLGPIIGLAAAIPTPGRLGTSQGAWLLMFQHQAEPAALVAFSLLWTVVVSLIRWLIGALFLAWPGNKMVITPEEK